MSSVALSMRTTRVGKGTKKAESIQIELRIGRPEPGPYHLVSKLNLEMLNGKLPLNRFSLRSLRRHSLLTVRKQWEIKNW